MKKLLLVAALLIVGFAPTLKAQYEVKKGDTLYALAGQHLESTDVWEKIYQANPFLREKGRRFETPDGKTVVLIRPGEVLLGLTPIGVVAVERPELLSTLKGETKVVENEAWSLFKWIMLLLLAIFAGFLIWLLFKKNELSNAERAEGIRQLRDRNSEIARERENVRLNSDPVAGGPPVVPGGITMATAPDHFRNMGVNIWRETTGRQTTPDLMTILEIIPGLAWGRMLVSYANGRAEERRLNGQRVFRGRVRFPDGIEETLYMLQGCGNDVRISGNRNTPADDFRFVPDSEAVAPVAPAPTPVVAQATVTPVVTAVESEEVPEGTFKLEIKKATDGKPAMVRISGVDVERHDLTLEMSDKGITLRVG